MYSHTYVFTEQDKRTPRGLHQMRRCRSLEHSSCVQQHQTQHPLQLLGAQVQLLFYPAARSSTKIVWHRCVWFCRRVNLTTVQCGALMVFSFLQSCQSKDMDEKIKSYRQAIFKLDHAERIQRKRDESGVSASQDQSLLLTFGHCCPCCTVLAPCAFCCSCAISCDPKGKCVVYQ